MIHLLAFYCDSLFRHYHPNNTAHSFCINDMRWLRKMINLRWSLLDESFGTLRQWGSLPWWWFLSAHYPHIENTYSTGQHLPWNRLWIRENSFGHYLCITRSPGCIRHEFGIKQCLTLRVFRLSEFWTESCFMAENIWWVVRWRMDCRGVAFVGHMLESFMRNFNFNERRDRDGLG